MNNREHLFDYAEDLLKFALRKTGNFEQAEDLVSETIISAIVALVYQGAWNGWYKNEFARKNESVPAFIICLGKKLTDEELKNPRLWKKD